MVVISSIGWLGSGSAKHTKADQQALQEGNPVGSFITFNIQRRDHRLWREVVPGLQANQGSLRRRKRSLRLDRYR